jgi:hypothetical protein
MKKKFNKVVSLALASVMAMGLFTTVNLGNISAKADQNENEESATTTSYTVYDSNSDTQNISVKDSSGAFIKIPVEKEVKVDKAGTLLPTETFTFDMTPADDLEGTETDSNKQPVSEGIALTSSTIGIKFDSSDDTSQKVATRTGYFDLNFTSDFDHTGVYRYYVTENLPDSLIEYNKENNTNRAENGYITFDTRKYIVDLYVSQDTNGKYYVSEYVVTEKDKDTKPNNILFVNSIKCSSLIIKKIVSGTEYQSGEYYTFRILIPKKGDTIVLEKNQKFIGHIYNGNTLVIDPDRTDEDGNVEIKVDGDTINENDYQYYTTFKLKAGESLEIDGLPVSMIYKVLEDTSVIPGGNEYTVTYDMTSTGKFFSGEGAAEKNNIQLENQEYTEPIKGAINTGENEIDFTNTRNINVGTGLSIDFLPYALVLIVAVCGSILFIIAKKRKQ